MRTALALAALAAVLALAACNRGTHDRPIAPEVLAQQAHAAIVSGANTLLLGDRLGYDASDDEVERVNTNCEGDRCAIGFWSERRASGVGVNSADLTLLRERRGVTLFREETALGWGDFEGYGGWLEYSIFATEATLVTADPDPDRGVTRVANRSLGFSSGENPRAVEGSARWEGLMLGRDMRASPGRGRTLRGDADVTVDFAAGGVTAAVEFARIVDVETGDLHDGMAWSGLAVEGGAFARRNAPDDTITGRFYGPGEEEVGGVFERGGIAGAFGARRTSAP